MFASDKICSYTTHECLPGGIPNINETLFRALRMVAVKSILAYQRRLD